MLKKNLAASAMLVSFGAAHAQNLEPQLQSFDRSSLDGIERFSAAIERKGGCDRILTTPYCKFLIENNRAEECPSLLGKTGAETFSEWYGLFSFDFDVREFEAMNWLELNSLSEDEAVPNMCFLANVWRPMKEWYSDTAEHLPKEVRSDYLCAGGMC